MNVNSKVRWYPDSRHSIVVSYHPRISEQFIQSYIQHCRERHDNVQGINFAILWTDRTVNDA